MSLSDLASLGSFVSGFAVLISLIYLALQVRQTERNQQISIRHSRVSRTVELHLALADPSVADAWLHGTGRPQEITQTEVSQFIHLCRAHFFHFEDSFYQREGGLLNDEAFETVVAGARLLARSPGVRAAWRIARPNFGGRFLGFMDGWSQSPPSSPPWTCRSRRGRSLSRLKRRGLRRRRPADDERLAEDTKSRRATPWPPRPRVAHHEVSDRKRC
jgi:hypothetical protein